MNEYLNSPDAIINNRFEVPRALDIAGATLAADPQKPNTNNDGYFIDNHTGLAIVCDGAGHRVHTKDTVVITLQAYQSILDDFYLHHNLGDFPETPSIVDTKKLMQLGLEYAVDDLETFYRRVYPKWEQALKPGQMDMATTIAIEMEADGNIVIGQAGDTVVLARFKDGSVWQSKEQSIAQMYKESGNMTEQAEKEILNILRNGRYEHDFLWSILPNGARLWTPDDNMADYWYWEYPEAIYVKNIRDDSQGLSNYVAPRSLLYQNPHLTFDMIPTKEVTDLVIASDGIMDVTTPAWLMDYASELREEGHSAATIARYLVLHSRLNAENGARYGGDVDDATLVYKRFV